MTEVLSALFFPIVVMLVTSMVLGGVFYALIWTTDMVKEQADE